MVISIRHDDIFFKCERNNESHKFEGNMQQLHSMLIVNNRQSWVQKMLIIFSFPCDWQCCSGGSPQEGAAMEQLLVGPPCDLIAGAWSERRNLHPELWDLELEDVGRCQNLCHQAKNFSDPLNVNPANKNILFRNLRKRF